MELTELLGLFDEQNKSGKGYQVHLNSGNLDSKTVNQNTDVEFGDLYFLKCDIVNKTILCLDNASRKPIAQKEDGTNIHPMDINSMMFIDLCKVESVEDVKDFRDWFVYPSERVINIYMFPQNKFNSGCKNVITIGFMG